MLRAAQKPGRGAEHHDEQANSLDEHGSLVDTIGPLQQGSLQTAGRTVRSRPRADRRLDSGRERIVPMRR